MKYKSFEQYIEEKMLSSIKAGEESEVEGLDKTELGIEAYPDFSK